MLFITLHRYIQDPNYINLFRIRIIEMWVGKWTYIPLLVYCCVGKSLLENKVPNTIDCYLVPLKCLAKMFQKRALHPVSTKLCQLNLPLEKLQSAIERCLLENVSPQTFLAFLSLTTYASAIIAQQRFTTINRNCRESTRFLTEYYLFILNFKYKLNN